MTIKYCMAKTTVSDFGINRGGVYIVIAKEHEWLAIHEDDERGKRCLLSSITSVNFDKYFVEMTQADYETYCIASMNGYEDVWLLLRRIYNCN